MFHYFMGVAKRVGPTLMDGKAVTAMDKFLYALGGVFVYRPFAQHAGPEPGARGLHGGRGDWA